MLRLWSLRSESTTTWCGSMLKFGHGTGLEHCMHGVLCVNGVHNMSCCV